MDDNELEKVKASLRIVNGHYQLWCSHRIRLQQLITVINGGKFHVGRPTMVSCLIMEKRVQFFPNGSIQILAGGMTRILFYKIFHMIYHLLSVSNSVVMPMGSETFHLSRWIVNNIVIQFDLNDDFTFHQLMCNGKQSYEPEIFPAVLISKHESAHVTLFPNGKGIITGIRQRSKAMPILRNVLSDLQHRRRRR